MLQEPDRQRRDPRWRETAIAELIRATSKLIDALDLYLDAKFNPGQLRVPAGNPDGGEWTTGEGSEADTSDVPSDETLPIELIASKPIPPGAIQSLYRDYLGHHAFPLAEAQLRANVLSPDAIEVFRERQAVMGN